MQKHKRKRTHDSATQLACFNCGRSGSFWVARKQEEYGEEGKLVIIPRCSRCMISGDEVVYDPLDHGHGRDIVWEAAYAAMGKHPACMNKTKDSRSSALWNVRPAIVAATHGLTVSLQQYLNSTLGENVVDVTVDQRMYGTWERDYRHDYLSVRVSSLSCLQNLQAIGIWSQTDHGTIQQVDLISGDVQPGAAVRIHWFDDDTILVKPECDEDDLQAINVGSSQGIRSQSFGLFVRSTNGSCSFTLDYWNGEGVRTLAFQNPQRVDQWILACNHGQLQEHNHSFSHPILEISGMLPERCMLTPSVSRYLDYQRELV